MNFISGNSECVEAFIIIDLEPSRNAQYCRNDDMIRNPFKAFWLGRSLDLLYDEENPVMVGFFPNKRSLDIAQILRRNTILRVENFHVHSVIKSSTLLMNVSCNASRMIPVWHVKRKSVFAIVWIGKIEALYYIELLANFVKRFVQALTESERWNLRGNLMSSEVSESCRGRSPRLLPQPCAQWLGISLSDNTPRPTAKFFSLFPTKFRQKLIQTT